MTIENVSEGTNDAKNAALAVSLSIQDGQWDKLDQLLDVGFSYSGDGFNFNKDQYIGFMQDMRDAFEGMKMEFTHVMADGEFVTINFISRAKNTGKFMGAPATGRSIEVRGTLIRQMRNGKAIQEWQTTDLLGVMTQMGFGALFGYSVAVGLFKVKPKEPKRRALAAGSK